MKKLYVILFMVFLNSALFSCTPQSIDHVKTIAGDENPDEPCCDQEGDIPPP